MTRAAASPGASDPVLSSSRLLVFSPFVHAFTPTTAAGVRAAIRLAGGREVCFVCTIDERDAIVSARVVARGDVRSVLALPGFAQRGEMLLHNHPSGNLEPSSPDMEIAARMHDAGVGFAITDNEASELYVVVEVPREKRAAPLDIRAVDALLGAGGKVAGRHQRYEDRASQRGFARTIARLYNGGGIGVLEAGTGVGKSLGYLIPALRWAAQNGERTVVSTNTINLQEQLVGKDLPFLALALDDQPVRFALLKGWHNYVCLYRLDQARGAGATLFDQGSAAEVETLVEWAEHTGDGSISDLATPPRPDVWDEVAAEPDLCLRLQCPHFDRCFLFAARRQAAQADVIVVNHHLLLADLAVRRASQKWDDAAVLPPYTRLVVDEGHHLEDAAASPPRRDRHAARPAASLWPAGAARTRSPSDAHGAAAGAQGPAERRLARPRAGAPLPGGGGGARQGGRRLRSARRRDGGVARPGLPPGR